MVMLAYVFLAAQLLAIVSASQTYFNVDQQQNALRPDAGRNLTIGSFAPVGSLSNIRDGDFTMLGHPLFPNYGVRIKQSKFCDETVQAFTGYIDVGARHLFFYFFESRSEPDKDDVIFWTNGGPGCSSSLGLFMELGPCRIPDSNGTKRHAESWNNKANVFFIDQPVGVGFSYADYGESVSTSEEAAQDVAAFVSIFFENFTQFKGRKFHMAGESYGGRYIPLFAAAVYDQNARLEQAGMTPINLQSAMIGNGMTDPYKTFLSYYDIQCTPASVPPFIDISSCVLMKTMAARCEKWMQESCQDQYDKMNCVAATSMCRTIYYQAYAETGKNPYDISRPCDGNITETLCYPVTKFIRDYLDKPSTHKILGVDPSFKKKPFSSCSDSVGHAFSEAGDITRPSSIFHVSALLERGIRVLIYAGTYDLVCNWVGNERWTLALEWSGQDEFRRTELKEWKVDGKRAGLVRSAKGLTFLTIEEAGHMVPYDKPKEALEMANRWLAKAEF